METGLSFQGTFWGQSWGWLMLERTQRTWGQMMLSWCPQAIVLSRHPCSASGDGQLENHCLSLFTVLQLLCVDYFVVFVPLFSCLLCNKEHSNI